MKCVRYPIPKSLSSGKGLTIASLKYVLVLLTVDLICDFWKVIIEYEDLYVTLSLNPFPRERDLLSLRSKLLLNVK